MGSTIIDFGCFPGSHQKSRATTSLARLKAASGPMAMIKASRPEKKDGRNHGGFDIPIGSMGLVCLHLSYKNQ